MPEVWGTAACAAERLVCQLSGEGGCGVNDYDKALEEWFAAMAQWKDALASTNMQRKLEADIEALITRLLDVQETALGDSYSSESEFAVGSSEHDACQAERDKLQAVVREVITTLRAFAS